MACQRKEEKRKMGEQEEEGGNTLIDDVRKFPDLALAPEEAIGGALQISLTKEWYDMSWFGVGSLFLFPLPLRKEYRGINAVKKREGMRSIADYVVDRRKWNIRESTLVKFLASLQNGRSNVQLVTVLVLALLSAMVMDGESLWDEICFRDGRVFAWRRKEQAEVWLKRVVVIGGKRCKRLRE